MKRLSSRRRGVAEVEEKNPTIIPGNRGLLLSVPRATVVGNLGLVSEIQSRGCRGCKTGILLPFEYFHLDHDHLYLFVGFLQVTNRRFL